MRYYEIVNEGYLEQFKDDILKAFSQIMDLPYETARDIMGKLDFNHYLLVAKAIDDEDLEKLKSLVD